MDGGSRCGCPGEARRARVARRADPSRARGERRGRGRARAASPPVARRHVARARRG